MRRPSAFLGRSLLCLALIAVAGCGAGQSAPELLASARVQALVLLAEAQAAAKRTDEAVETLRRAQVLVPNSLRVHQRLVATLLAAGRSAQAQSAARDLQRNPATQAMGYVLEGDLLAAQRSWREAAAAFRLALQQQPTSTGAVSLHSTLLAYDKAEAAAFAVKWMGGHADDAGLAMPTMPASRATWVTRPWRSATTRRLKPGTARC